ncbi:MAG: YIP1 family protein [Candidatus Eisenbacteria sp.]|nr:YIP1 family protein [Candidatus Eisenbacteria bacterium]
MESIPPSAGESSERRANAVFPSPAQRLLLILLRPTQAFRGLDRERLSWLLPAVLVAVVTILPSQTLLRPLYIEHQQQALETYVARGILTPEQAHEMMRQLPEPQTPPGAGGLVLPLFAGTLAQIVLRYLLPAALLLGGAAFVLEVRVRFGTMLGIVGFASLPAALRELLRLPLALATDRLTVTFSPAAFTGGDSFGSHALGLLDIFDLWILGLLMVGLMRVANVTLGKAALLVLPLWGVYSLMKLGLRASPFGAGL